MGAVGSARAGGENVLARVSELVFVEAIKGSITAGKLADYVVLAADPHTVDPENITDIPIVRTVVGGTISHQA